MLQSNEMGMSQALPAGYALTIIGIALLFFGLVNPMFLSNITYETGKDCPVCGGDGINPAPHLMEQGWGCRSCDGTGNERVFVTDLLNPWTGILGTGLLSLGIMAIIYGMVLKSRPTRLTKRVHLIYPP
jgi:uncharacterized membrane protein